MSPKSSPKPCASRPRKPRARARVARQSCILAGVTVDAGGGVEKADDPGRLPYRPANVRKIRESVDTGTRTATPKSPANNRDSGPRAARLKIVVSPVRVRVSPSVIICKSRFPSFWSHAVEKAGKGTWLPFPARWGRVEATGTGRLEARSTRSVSWAAFPESPVARAIVRGLRAVRLPLERHDDQGAPTRPRGGPLGTRG